ncbi:gag-pol polyprotein [Tanacetum coccineum]
MHNNIIAAGSRDHPPMLAPGRYAQDEIYSTVDACKTAHDMWIAIERLQHDNQTGHFGNQRTVTVAGDRETVDSQVVQQNRIHCFNCKEFGHFAKECRKPKRVKDYTYHTEKMLLCKQAEKGVPLQVEQADWLEDTNEEIDEQELEAHYFFMVQYDAEYNVFTSERQHFEQPESIGNTRVVERFDSNVTPDLLDMYDNDIQTNQNAEEERVALANLIANLTLDT